MGIKYLTPETVKQYQYEERTNIARRAKSSNNKLNELLICMENDSISSEEKVYQLKHELSSHHRNDGFLDAKNMGELVHKNISLLIQKEFIHSMDNEFKR
jgi:hypothetical protein